MDIAIWVNPPAVGPSLSPRRLRRCLRIPLEMSHRDQEPTMNFKVNIYNRTSYHINSYHITVEYCRFNLLIYLTLLVACSIQILDILWHTMPLHPCYGWVSPIHHNPPLRPRKNSKELGSAPGKSHLRLAGNFGDFSALIQ